MVGVLDIKMTKKFNDEIYEVFIEEENKVIERFRRKFSANQFIKENKNVYVGVHLNIRKII